MKRVHDDFSASSTSSAADWPAAAAQPGARHPARPRAFPPDAVPEALQGLGRAPGLVDDAPPGLSGRARRVQLHAAPANLPDRPDAAPGPASSGLLQGGGSPAPGQRAERRVDLAYVGGRLWAPVDLQAVQGILATAGSLGPEQRWAALKPLCELVHRLPEAERTSTWHAVVRAYLAVPPEQLAAAFAQLHDQVRTLRSAGEAERLAEPLLQAVLQEGQAWLRRGQSFPPDARDTMLSMFVPLLADLPLVARRPFFRLALRSVAQLGEAQRGVRLEALSRAVAALPDAARQPEWQATLNAIEQLPPLQRSRLYEPMAAQTGGLPTVEARAGAFAALLQAHRRLPEGHEGRAASVIALGTACLAQPRAHWQDVLPLVLAESATVPGLEQQAVSLLGLAGKFCLAEPAVDGSIDPAPPDTPRRDARVQCLDKIMTMMPLLPLPPAEFVARVNALSGEVERLMQQRPHDAAVLTELLEPLRRLGG